MPPLTLIHVVISLVGIVSGVVVVRGVLASQHHRGWVSTFLWSTLATSATGFLFFPLKPLLPGHLFGVITFLVLGPAMYGLYARQLVGGWRKTYVIGSLVALYLNVFVLIVQLFRKVPALHLMAPTESEPPFAIAQLVTLILFITLGVLGVKRFRAEPTAA